MKQKNIILLFTFSLSFLNLFSQYAPPAGFPGSTAISKDSSIIQSWATHCHVIRGWQNITDTSLGKASFGTPSNAIGIADNNVISLGDSGIAIVSFNGVIYNGPGYDFAIFENAFNNSFLELAFVEVSSDSINWVRFPSVSLTDTSTQVGTFDTLDATKIHNLAGKYKALYGTPFDLEDIADSENVNIDSIKYIKIIDVIGNIHTHCSHDSQGHKINDPFPTPFNTSGFDLDAVATLNFHQYENQQNPYTTTSKFIKIYPVPTHNTLNLKWEGNHSYTIKILTAQGSIIYNTTLFTPSNKIIINTSNWKAGIYFLNIYTKENNIVYHKKIIIN